MTCNWSQARIEPGPLQVYGIETSGQRGNPEKSELLTIMWQDLKWPFTLNGYILTSVQSADF